jgi:glutamyl-tRNA reductase
VTWPGFGLPGVVAVVVALAGPWNLDHEEAARLRRRGAVVVDLSAPPALDDPARQVLGEHYVSIDDLAWVGAEVAAEERLEHVKALVGEAGRSYGRWLACRATRPVLHQLGTAAESRRRRELEWLLRRLPQLSDRERALVDQMSHRLVAGILHAPRAALGSGGDELAPAARRLFGL